MSPLVFTATFFNRRTCNAHEFDRLHGQDVHGRRSLQYIALPLGARQGSLQNGRRCVPLVTCRYDIVHHQLASPADLVAASRHPTGAINGGDDRVVKLFMQKTLLLLVIGHATLLAACGTWKAEKLEATTAQAIDDHLPSGMSVAAFQEEFPQAVLVDGDDHNGNWFVSV